MLPICLDDVGHKNEKDRNDDNQDVRDVYNWSGIQVMQEAVSQSTHEWQSSTFVVIVIKLVLQLTAQYSQSIFCAVPSQHVCKHNELFVPFSVLLLTA